MPVAPPDRHIPHKRPASRSRRHSRPKRPQTLPGSFRTEAASGQGYPSKPKPRTKPGGYQGKGKKRRYVLPRYGIAPGDAGHSTTPKQQAAIDRGVRNARRSVVRNRPSLIERINGPGRGRAETYARLDTALRKQRADNAAAIAPILPVLEQISRPIHAVAAATRAEIAQVKKRGFNPLDVKPNRANIQAASRGFALKDRSLFSDVLDDLGVENRLVKGAGGFALDVALDPLTYLTLGAATPATTAARSAARKAERAALSTPVSRRAAEKAYDQALKRGATPKQARNVARQAQRTHARRSGKRAGEQAGQGRAANNGLDVRFAGQSLPGVTRATAAAKRAPRAAADRAGLSGGRLDRAQQGVRDAVRSSVSEVNPNITPPGVDREAYQAMRRAARTARARTQRGDVYAALRAQSFVDRVGAGNAQRVIYAIEEGTTSQLPKGLRAEAARFTGDMRRMLKEEQRAGIKVGDRTQVGDVVNYVKQLRVGDDQPRGAARGRRVDPTYAKARTEGTIREKNTAEPGAYSEDIGQVYAARASEHSRSVAAARLNQALGRAGQRVSGSKPRNLGEHESYYRIDGADLVKLNPKSQEAKILQNGWDTERRKIAARLKAQGKSPEQIRNALATVKRKVEGQHVVLNDKALERTAGTVLQAGERTTPGVFFDKAQGVWKVGATVINPGYYVRNYAGEAQNAYLKENPARLARNVVASGRALKEVRKREEAARKGEAYRKRGPSTTRTVTEKRTRTVPDRHPNNVLHYKPRKRGEWGRGILYPDGRVVTTAYDEATHKQLAARFGEGGKNFDIKPDGEISPRVLARDDIPTVLAADPRLHYGDWSPKQKIETIETARNVRVRGAKQSNPYAELIDKAEDVGAIRAGQYAREVGQLLARESGKKPARLKGSGPLRRAARFRDNIEDQFRLASFKGGLDRGLEPEQAMQRASKTHFDYGDLTKSERVVLRRVMPFYTFSARNIPLQIKMLVQRPGKFAVYEKARGEFAKAFGFEEGWEQNLAEHEQRAAPFPVKWKGTEFTLSLGPSGLPLTDLNEVPTGPGVLDEWLNRAASMVSPAIKSPVELWANFSFFFRDQLERDNSPLVAAPAWAQHLPDEIKEMTGLVPDFYNRKTGKYGWGWRAKADYIVNQVPGPAAFASRLSKESTRQGQSDMLDTLAYLGPRIRPIDSAAVTLNNLYDEREKILKEQATMRQRNVKTGRVPARDRERFLELRKRARVVDVQIKRLSVEIETKLPAAPDPERNLQDEILKRMTQPAQGPSGSALEEEIRRRLGG